MYEYQKSFYSLFDLYLSLFVSLLLFFKPLNTFPPTIYPYYFQRTFCACFYVLSFNKVFRIFVLLCNKEAQSTIIRFA